MAAKFITVACGAAGIIALGLVVYIIINEVKETNESKDAVAACITNNEDRDAMGFKTAAALEFLDALKYALDSFEAKLLYDEAVRLEGR